MASLEYRDYQNRITTQAIEHFNNNVSSVGIVSPTGSGKTIISMNILKEIGKNKKINWVAMRRNLLIQAAKMNQEFFGLDNIQFVSMFDNNPPEADIVVIDELHHASTSSFVHIDSVSQPDFLLGLSATPFRSDKLKLPFQKMIRDAGIHRLIQEGWLPKFHQYIIDTFDPKSVAETYANEPERWGKTVVFFQTVGECYEFQYNLGKHNLGKRNLTSEVIHGGMTESKKDEILNKFEDGGVSVLVNAAILTEGFDSPSLKTVFVRDSSRLPTIQMAGRAFRKSPGKDHCNVVQSKTTKWQFTKTATSEKTFIHKEGEWYSLGANDAVITVSDTMRMRITMVEAHIPNYIQNRKRKRRVI